MKKARILAAVLAAVLCVPSAAAWAAEETTAAEERTYIVKLREDVPMLLSADEEADTALGFGMFLVTEEQAQALMEAGLAEFAEPDGEVELFAAPTDTKYKDQWHLQTGFGMDLAGVWDTYTGAGVKIGVVDSGLIPDHEDLDYGGHVLEGFSLAYPEGSSTIAVTPGREAVTDELSHGTMVTGIINAAHNGKGVAGVAPGATILPIKCFVGRTTKISLIVRGINEAVNEGCDVINLSCGATKDNSSKPMNTATQAAVDAGIIVVSAVGNGYGTALYYPAAYDQVVGVGAIDSAGAKAGYSQSNESVWVAAPGSGIWSLSYTNPNGYVSGSGTSFAAPCVSGLAALALEKAGKEGVDLTPQGFQDLLAFTAQDAGEAGYDYDYGWGIVNAPAMMAEIRNYTITYHLNGGTMPTQIAAAAEGETPAETPVTATYHSYDGTIALPVPTREGYSFAGWYESADLSGTGVTELAGETRADKEYYAKWLNTDATLKEVYFWSHDDATNTTTEYKDAPQTMKGNAITIYVPKGADFTNCGLQVLLNESTSTMDKTLEGNTWTIKVTAQDTSIVETYTVTVDASHVKAEPAVEPQSGEAAPGSLDGKTAAVRYETDVAAWFTTGTDAPTDPADPQPGTGSDEGGETGAGGAGETGEPSTEGQAAALSTKPAEDGPASVQAEVPTETSPAAQGGETVNDGPVSVQAEETGGGTAPALTYAIVPADPEGVLPVGLELKGSALTYTPAAADAGKIYKVQVTAADGPIVSAPVALTLTVGALPYSAPVLESAAGTFDAAASPAPDLTVGMTTYGATLDSVTLGEKALVKDTDYVVVQAQEVDDEAETKADETTQKDVARDGPNETNAEVKNGADETKNRADETQNGADETAQNLEDPPADDPLRLNAVVFKGTYLSTLNNGEQVFSLHFSSDKDAPEGASPVTYTVTVSGKPEPTPTPANPSGGGGSGGGGGGGFVAEPTPTPTPEPAVTTNPDGSALLELPEGEETVSKAQAQAVVKANEEAPVTVKTEKVTVIIPSGTLSKDADVSAMIPDTGKATGKAGEVVAYVDDRGERHIVPISLVEADQVLFVAPAEGKYEIVDNPVEYADMGSHWATGAAGFVSSHGLFQGTGGGAFSPDMGTSRAMVFTVLARLDGSDPTPRAGEKWYGPALAWGVESGLTDGSDPEGAVSREQLATLLWRYAGCPEVKGGLADYADGDKVSSWADQALAWAVESGIVTGRPGKVLDPSAGATRAEVAVMFQRFVPYLLKK